jgi:hypothetical protein
MILLEVITDSCDMDYIESLVNTHGAEYIMMAEKAQYDRLKNDAMLKTYSNDDRIELGKWSNTFVVYFNKRKLTVVRV